MDPRHLLVTRGPAALSHGMLHLATPPTLSHLAAESGERPRLLHPCTPHPKQAVLNSGEQTDPEAKGTVHMQTHTLYRLVPGIRLCLSARFSGVARGERAKPGASCRAIKGVGGPGGARAPCMHPASGPWHRSFLKRAIKSSPQPQPGHKGDLQQDKAARPRSGEKARSLPRAKGQEEPATASREERMLAMEVLLFSPLHCKAGGERHRRPALRWEQEAPLPSRALGRTGRPSSRPAGALRGKLGADVPRRESIKS